MKIHRVFLSEKIEEKIWREHHVERWEVFDIFYNDEPKIYRRSLEHRRYWVALSKTTAGRLLSVFYVLRRDVAYVHFVHRRLRLTVATAYDMPERYRRIYRGSQQ
jgi:hypothetical protein